MYCFSQKILKDRLQWIPVLNGLVSTLLKMWPTQCYILAIFKFLNIKFYHICIPQNKPHDIFFSICLEFDQFHLNKTNELRQWLKRFLLNYSEYIIIA